MADELPERPADHELVAKYLQTIQDRNKSGPKDVTGIDHVQADQPILVGLCPNCRQHIATSGEGFVLCSTCGMALTMTAHKASSPVKQLK